MAILDPGHLFDQAELLSSPSATGTPRQVDLRRAVSTAYYGVFHFILAALADQFVGAAQRTTARYALVYRSVGHRGLKDLCTEVEKPRPTQRYAPYWPASGFDPSIKNLATETRELQEQRHLADYDPMLQFSIEQVRLTIEAARSAVRPFDRADPEHRRVFLTLLLCPPH